MVNDNIRLKEIKDNCKKNIIILKNSCKKTIHELKEIHKKNFKELISDCESKLKSKDLTIKNLESSISEMKNGYVSKEKGKYIFIKNVKYNKEYFKIDDKIKKPNSFLIEKGFVKQI